MLIYNQAKKYIIEFGHISNESLHNMNTYLIFEVLKNGQCDWTKRHLEASLILRS